MNQQPLNLLTTAPVPSQAAADNERQLALANLFSSLSSLAQQQQQAMARPQLDEPQPVPVTTASSSLQMLPPQVHPSNFALNTGKHQDNSFASFIAHQQDLQVPKQQQRINYCTICNKELCNKYFMKTHMLKMHGINLEMEQPNEGECDDGDEEEQEDGEDRTEEREPEQLKQQDEELSEVDLIQNDEPLDCKKVPTSRAASKKSPQNNSQSKPKQQKLAGGKSSATSVLNGFAGNSMGGVVCDICNKELCSKYFLKVHKQNTHGIVTDYTDASHHHSQFIYPFGAALPVPAVSPFLGPSVAPVSLPNPVTFPPILPMMSADPSGLFSSSPATNPTPTTTTTTAAAAIMDPKRPVKRPRLAATGCGDAAASNIEPQSLLESATPREQLESVYRLIIAQQHQHQSSGPPMSVQTSEPSIALGALMCFGAMGSGAAGGPFGAGPVMSPAMIVDHILRNQHLFNNRGANHPVARAPPADKNNNNSSNNDKGKSSSNSKDSSNSRYYSHYTEACPMCERRFKSIKWLKTHMMNDHKQEIGAYMQMMMQYLYASKSQQMTATMAVLEQQQQQQQQNFAHQFSGHHMNLQLPATTLPPLAPPAPVRHQPSSRRSQAPQLVFQQPANVASDVSRTAATTATTTALSIQYNPKRMVKREEDYVIDARCRRESLSPSCLAGASSLLASPSTQVKLAPPTPPQHNFNATPNEFTFDFNRFQRDGCGYARGSDEDEDNSSDSSLAGTQQHQHHHLGHSKDGADQHHVKTTNS